MEGKEDIQIYGVENMIHFGDSSPAVAVPAVAVAVPAVAVAVPAVAVAVPAVAVPAPAVAVPEVAVPAPAVAAPEGVAGEAPVSVEVKKKRGRPRKNAADGNLALSPMPISASLPMPRGGKAAGSYKKKQRLELESSPGDMVAYSVGANFTPHMITVNAGQDISMNIMTFSHQGSRAICILAANGAVSNVTLRQPNSSGGTLTYEGRFEILSLSGSFMPIDNRGMKSISGGMSVSLAGPDGHVVGGGLAGLLIAAGPVQVVIGSFLTGYRQEPKPKKQRPEFGPTLSPVPAAPTLTPVPATNHNYAGGNDAVYTGPLRSITPASYHEKNASAGTYVNGHTVAAENNIFLPGEGQTVVVAAENNIFLPGEGQTVVVAAENNIFLPGEGQTVVVAAENNIFLPGEGQTVVAAENNIFLPGEGQTVVVAAENEISLPGEGQTVVAAENKISFPGEGQTAVAAEKNISLPGGQTAVAAENNISLSGEGQTGVAAENNKSLPGGGQTVGAAEESQTIVAAENNKSLPGGGQTVGAAEESQIVVAAENNKSLPGGGQTVGAAEESQTIVAAENKLSIPLESEKLSPSKCVISC